MKSYWILFLDRGVKSSCLVNAESFEAAYRWCKKYVFGPGIEIVAIKKA